MSEYIWVYVTHESLEQAKLLSRELVQEKLVACANILPAMTAIYGWKGNVEEAQEVAIIFKTQKNLFSLLRDKILQKHPYECPCIVALPIEFGNEKYLEWIKSQTVPD